MDRYNKYQTKQYTHAHTYTLHTQHMMASTWLGDHQGRPAAPTNSLHKLHMARYQVGALSSSTYNTITILTINCTVDLRERSIRTFDYSSPYCASLYGNLDGNKLLLLLPKLKV